MNRRQMLAGTAALPAAALPIPALAIAANGTDAAWRALVTADAAHSAADAALAAAEDAAWTEPPPTPTVELPRILGDREPLRLTLAELRDTRKTDPMFRGPDKAMEQTFRELLDREMRLRQMRTPENIAERHALYDRLEAELVAKGEPARPPKAPRIARLEDELKAAETGRRSRRSARIRACPRPGTRRPESSDSRASAPRAAPPPRRARDRRRAAGRRPRAAPRRSRPARSCRSARRSSRRRCASPAHSTSGWSRPGPGRRRGPRAASGFRWRHDGCRRARECRPGPRGGHG